MTDNVTQAVYRAEWALRFMLDNAGTSPSVTIHGSTLTLPVERRFGNLANVQTYCDKVLALNWVQAKYPRALRPVVVRERKGQEKAHYERMRAVIAVPPYERGKAWAMREIVVLHELAHHLDTGYGHGVTFTATYEDLVTELIGPEAGFILRALYYDEGVK